MKFWFLSVLLLQCLSKVIVCLNITIDPVNGINNGCQNGSHPCLNLTVALNVRSNGVQYLLYPGTHYLNQDLEPFTGLSNLVLSADPTRTRATDVVTVLCANGTGFSFQRVSAVTIKEITFTGCGMLQNGTICDPQTYHHGDDTCILAKVRVGIYFYQSNSVSLQSIVVTSSLNATGLVISNTVGNVIISDSVFSRNGLGEGLINSGWGGVHVEFSYCGSGNTCAVKAPPTIFGNSVSVYSIYRCNFTYNMAQIIKDKQTFSLPTFGYQAGFGHGAGLSVLFSGNASNNTIIVSNCNILRNNGGGIFLGLYDNATWNSFSLLQSSIIENSGVRGGGISISDNVVAGNNRIEILDCIFSSNFAGIGGAFYLLSTLHKDPNSQYATYNCSFVNNSAVLLGAAISASLQLISHTGTPPALVFDGSTIVSGNSFKQIDYKYYESQIGTIYTYGVPLVVKGRIMLENNRGSALTAIGAYVDFCHCSASFTANHGVQGGAIALYSGAYLHLCSSTVLNFTRNNATLNGGAIYNLYVQNIKAECFLNYEAHNELPNNWKATFLFNHNRAQFGGNSIYSSSILPCSIDQSSPQNTFCWNKQYWSYTNGSGDEIATAASHVIWNETTLKIYPGQVFSLMLSVRDDLNHDVLNETVYAASITGANATLAKVSDGFAYVSNGFIQVLSNATGNITIELDELGILGSHLNVELDIVPCPPGFKREKSICVCSQLSEDNYGFAILCTSIDTQVVALLRLNHWIGFYPGDNSSLVVGACAPGYCTGSSAKSRIGYYIRLPLFADELDGVICKNGRQGVLCGQCSEGYAVAINSPTYECVNCTTEAIHVGFYFGLSFIVPIVIALVGNYITSGEASSIILFSQLISSTYDLSAYGEIDIDGMYRSSSTMAKAYLTFYGIWNVDGLFSAFDPFCIRQNSSFYFILAMKYIIAIVPQALIILLVLILRCVIYTRCKNSRSCCFKFSSRMVDNLCCKKCHPCIRESIRSKGGVFDRHRHPMMLTAAFILISYNKLCITTSAALDVSSLLSSNGNRVKQFRNIYAGHLPLRWSFLVLFFFLFLFPLVLLICGCRGSCQSRSLKQRNNAKRSKCYLWCENDLDMLWDAFYSSYKPHAMWFASVYYFLRFSVSAFFCLAEPEVLILTFQQIFCVITLMIVVVCRPYREELINIWDAILLSYLLGMGLITQYNASVLGYTYQNLWVKSLWTSQFIFLILPFIVWIIMGVIYFARKRTTYHKVTGDTKAEDKRSGSRDDSTARLKIRHFDEYDAIDVSFTGSGKRTSS